MDPFSITVGIVGVVDGGLSLAGMLKDKVDAYRNAEQEVMELAHEVDLVTNLIDVLGHNLDKQQHLPPNVGKQTKRLVLDMRRIFDDIAELIKYFDASAKAKAGYVVDANALHGHHQKLKGLQLSFVFMLSVCSLQPSALPPSMSVAGGGAPGGLGSFEGTIQHVPIYSGSRDPNASSAPTTYQATLTLRPVAGQQPFGSAPPSGAPPTSQGPDMTEQLEEIRRNKTLKKKLDNLARNPFFSKDLFGMFSKTRRTVATRMYGAPETRQYVEKTSYMLPEDDAFQEREEITPRSRGKTESSRSARDVDDILQYLFDDDGAEANSDEDDRSYDDKTIDSTGSSPSPELEAYPGASTSRDPACMGAATADYADLGYGIPEAKPRKPSPYGRSAGPSLRPPNSVKGDKKPRDWCDGCDCEILPSMVRHECVSCKEGEFDFCDDCWHDPVKTLKHRHDKSFFVTRLPNRSRED